MIDTDVLIAGCGPAGISTWLHLNKVAPHLAHQTLVIEKAFFPRDKVCAGAVGGWSEDVFEYLDIKLDIPSLFIDRLEFRYGNNSWQLHPPTPVKVVQRLDFDHALAKIAVNRGLKINEGERLIHLVRQKKGILAITDGDKYCVKALVGADGAFSAVRRKMIPSHKPKFAPAIQTLSHVDSQYDPEFDGRFITLDFTPLDEGLQGYAWHIPCLKNDLPAMSHGIVDFRVHRDRPPANIKRIFNRVLQSRNIIQGFESWSSHPIPWLSEGDIVSQPNVFLVGDAAGIDPAFGGGVHLALSYGEVAAQTIIDAFRHNDFAFDDYKDRIASHLLGRTISALNQVALDIYSGKKDPLKVARNFFSGGYNKFNLSSLLLFKNSHRAP
jgi:menaquinone-9 beta-reductase